MLYSNFGKTVEKRWANCKLVLCNDFEKIVQEFWINNREILSNYREPNEKLHKNLRIIMKKFYTVSFFELFINFGKISRNF